MKPRIVILLVAFLLMASIGLSRTNAADKTADDVDSLGEWERLKKPLEKKNEDEPTVANTGRQALGVLEAIGSVTAELLGATAAGAELAALEQQFAPQFGQLLKAELRFVNKICRPTPEQFKTIKSAGEASVAVAVKKCAKAQWRSQRSLATAPSPEFSDPREIIAGALAKAVKQTLSAENVNRYQLELEKRAAARKHATLLNLVARLDQDLVLTPKQRTQLAESLTTHWKDDWAMRFDGQTLPALPDDQVLPVLNEAQKLVWKQSSKQDNSFEDWLGTDFIQAEEFNEDSDVSGAVETPAGKTKDFNENDKKNEDGKKEEQRSTKQKSNGDEK